MTDEDIFKTENVSSWPELKSILTDLKPGYIFRGQTKFEWDIKTTIERVSATHLWQAERRMFHKFEKNI